MMKAEFEEMIGKSVVDEEYKVIEAVYTWHPAINDTTGKDQMKTLYTQFGFGVIRGMLPVAEKMEKLDGERRELLAQLDTIKIREGLLAVGDMELEETIEKVNELYMKANTEEEFEQMMKSLDVRNEKKKHSKKSDRVLGGEQVYDYDGDMGYFQRQLERAGIGQEEVDMNNYAGLTARELQSIVDGAIKTKRIREAKKEA